MAKTTKRVTDKTKACRCGCGRSTKSVWAMGHDQAHKGVLLRRFDDGDEDAGRELVEVWGWRTWEQLNGRRSRRSHIEGVS